MDSLSRLRQRLQLQSPQVKKESQSSQSESLICNLLFTLLKFVIDSGKCKLNTYQIVLLQEWVDPESSARKSRCLHKPLMVFLLAETNLDFETLKIISYFVERFSHGQQIATLELLKSANITRMPT